MADPENTEEGQVEDEAKGQAEGEAEGQQAESQAEGEAKGEAEESETVPYERFQEVVTEMKALKEQNETIMQQQALARANPIQGQQEQAPQFDIYKEVGLDPEDPEDIPNQGQIKKILNHAGKVFSSQLAQIAFQQAHPDYAELVGSADEISSGKYAGPLAAAIKQNPALLTMIAKSGDPRLAAYEIAKLQKAKTKDEPVKKDEAKDAIDEAVENAKRVKSSSNAKGGGALSEEGRYEGMSDEEFVALALSNGAYI